MAKRKRRKESIPRRIGRFFGGLFLILIETVLLAALALYCVMFFLAKGPSETASELFLMSLQETSALKPLVYLFVTPEEMAQIMQRQEQEAVQSDTSKIHIEQRPEEPTTEEGPVPDAWGLVDEDGDGIIVEKVKGEGYTGYMMVVLDPSRVIVGCKPESFYVRGYTVAEMVEQFDAVAGVNAGGFKDDNGKGDGSTPDSQVVFEGKIYGGYHSKGFAGFDRDHILHVGVFTNEEIKERDIQYGVSFGPVLVVDGEPVVSEASATGLNPRTAIGQRSDGAVLLLVVDGRQAISLGATFWDLAEIFINYGAVNACNLDGGSSSLMWYQGDYINNCASVIGIRPVPTAIVVLKEGA